MAGIDTEGLKRMSRLYVHLSKDIATARKVGSRHGRPIVYEVASGQMWRDGFEFFLSANGVWLTKAVPVKYLQKVVPELADRKVYDTPIGPVCMSKTEHEAYLEEVELRKSGD